MPLEDCWNMDLLAAMNSFIELNCNRFLQNAVAFIENQLQPGQARNILSIEAGTGLNWHTVGKCSGWLFNNQLGNSLLFGRGCAKLTDAGFTFDFVWNLEDTWKAFGGWEALPNISFFVDARKRWTFHWQRGKFGDQRCTFDPPPATTCYPTCDPGRQANCSM